MVQVRYVWPTQEPRVVNNVLGTSIGLLQEKFGALSQDSDVYSRICIGNTAMSLEPYRGCPLDCKYCMANNDVRSLKTIASVTDIASAIIRKPELIYDCRDLLDALILHPAFIPNKTVIGFCIGSTEVFLPEVGENVWLAMQRLINYGLQNPIWLVVKSFLSENCKEWSNRLSQLTKSGIKCIISISDSGNPPDIEPYNEVNRFLPFKMLKDSGVFLSHHLRPIVNHANVLTSIRDSLNKSCDIVSSVCVGGLRIDPGMLLFWKQEESYDYLPGNQKKLLDSVIEDYATQICKKNGMPMFKHSSEVISYHLGIPDYNMNRYSTDDGFIKVPIAQVAEIERLTCRSLINSLKEIAQSIRLYNIDFMLNNEVICIKNKLKYQEYHALKQAIGFSGIFGNIETLKRKS